MSTRTDALLPPVVLDRRAPRVKAKDTSAAAPPREQAPRKRSASWDPYEVWRTRVKSPTDPE